VIDAPTFAQPEMRLRSDHVVIYRYRDGPIARQEPYADPSRRVEQLPCRR
jgi:hypothetical protein